MSRYDPGSSLPPGLLAAAGEAGDGTIGIACRRGQRFGRCPACGTRSDRVHGVHRRRLPDLPSRGRAVEPLVRRRRFRCTAGGCPRRTFIGPLSPEIAG